MQGFLIIYLIIKIQKREQDFKPFQGLLSWKDPDIKLPEYGTA